MTKAEKIFLDAQRHFTAEAYEKAFELHLKSAELDYAPAQSNVGYAYLHGKGVAQDYSKAIEWFEKAAAQDNTPAMINLGYCYTKGFGVPEDKEEAMNLFGRAAMLGSEQASKLYTRMRMELGMEVPLPAPEEPEEEAAETAEEAEEDTEEIVQEIPFEAPAETASSHYPDAKQRVRKLIGADYRWLLLALAATLGSYLLNLLWGEQLPELLYVLLWIVTLVGFLVVLAGVRGISGYRNARKCLNRLEELDLLDLAVEEIEFGDPQPFGFSGCITKNFVYGNGAVFAVADILWVYPKAENKFKMLKVASRTLPPMSLSGVPKRDRTGMLDKAIAELQSRNPGILSGNTTENKKAYEHNRCKS